MCNAKNRNYKGKMVCVPKGTYTTPVIVKSKIKKFHNFQNFERQKFQRKYQRSQVYRHNDYHDYHRPAMHRSRFLVSTKSDYPIPKFVRQCSNVLYKRWKTYPMDPSY